jgi:hypothetical protein
MPALIQPDACPDCREPIQLGYAQRKQAGMSPRLKLLLVAAIGSVILLVPLLFILTGLIVHELTEGMMLFRRERGVLFALLYLLSIPIALLPPWLAWRYACRQPRQLAVACPLCGWSGLCRVWEAELDPAVGAAGNLVEPGDPETPVVERERLERRRRKRLTQGVPEREPNPDFDFDQ